MPRLSTQVGDKQYKEYEKEIEQEKLGEERIDKKIRELRKEKNKARLHPTKPSGPNSKRRKIDKNNYVSIQEIWGKPDIIKPTKNPWPPGGSPSPRTNQQIAPPPSSKTCKIRA